MWTCLRVLHVLPIPSYFVLGKDRTGLISALVLSVCGVEREEIIENYYLSEVYLRFIGAEIRREGEAKGLGPEFDLTPREA